MISGRVEEGYFMAELLFDQRAAVVTGADQGIGREIGRSLTGCGAQAVLAGIHAELRDEAAAEIGGGPKV